MLLCVPSSHGRLDKTPGAIALRLRWYGPGDPRLVFVERKTHNEKWTGEVSVKERFTVDADEVPLVLTGKYPMAKKKREMVEQGKSEQEVEEWETLVRECMQVTVSKQLVRIAKSMEGHCAVDERALGEANTFFQYDRSPL